MFLLFLYFFVFNQLLALYVDTEILFTRCVLFLLEAIASYFCTCSLLIIVLYFNFFRYNGFFNSKKIERRRKLTSLEQILFFSSSFATTSTMVFGDLCVRTQAKLIGGGVLVRK